VAFTAHETEQVNVGDKHVEMGEIEQPDRDE
jgi:hypothetical protein